MKVKIDNGAIQRIMITKGLTLGDLDRRAKQRPSWAQKTFERAGIKGTLHQATIRKLAKALGCRADDIAIFGNGEAAPVAPLPRKRERKAA